MEASAEPQQLAGLALTRAVVLVVDLAESVRLMDLNEAGTVARWHRFTQHACGTVLPSHGGRLVKSLGDGLMAEFADVRAAVHAAADLHRSIEQDNPSRPVTEALRLRAGVHATRIYVDALDIYGAGVNLAARLASLAGPGETVLSAPARDSLVDGVDANLEDLGECFVKHLDRPVRAFRAGAAGPQPRIPPLRDPSLVLKPAIAVIPFVLRGENQPWHAAGDMLADGLIGRLCSSRHVRVISRLSTTVLRERQHSIDEMSTRLGATYVLSGSYATQGSHLLVNWELADARDGLVVAASRAMAPVADLFDPAGELVPTIAHAAHEAIFRSATQRALNQPLPTLDSYSLMLAGVQLLHRSTQRDFERSFQILEHLTQLHPQAVEPQAWLAKWYALRAVQGLTTDRARDAQLALALTSRALDRSPEDPFALAMEGFVHCHLSRKHDLARERLAAAVALNPSETFGQLFLGVVQGLDGQFNQALLSHEAAQASSPLDPANYLMDSIGAYLLLGHGQQAGAIDMARRSLRRNRFHAHTWRILTVAQVESGDLAGACESLAQVRALQPNLTVANYLGAARETDATRQRFALALQEAGLPAV